MAGAKPNEENAVRSLLAGFAIVQLTPEIAEYAAQIRRDRRIKLPDAIIQATAEVNGMSLVTRNTRDFPAEMPGIHIPYEF